MMSRYFYLMMVALLCWNCQPETAYTPPAVETQSEGIHFKQEFSMQAGEQVLLSGGTAPRKLHLTLQQLNDSRCPANATCVHYGAASVLLSLSNSQGRNDTVELCIGACSNEPPRHTHTVTIKVGQTSYKITLKEIKPFPGLEKFGDVKQAVLVVEKL